jgi:hypothetical protein
MVIAVAVATPDEQSEHSGSASDDPHWIWAIATLAGLVVLALRAARLNDVRPPGRTTAAPTGFVRPINAYKVTSITIPAGVL